MLQYLFLLQKPILQFTKAFLLPLDRPHHLDDLLVELRLGLLQRLHLDYQLSAENLLHLLHKPKYLGQYLRVYENSGKMHFLPLSFDFCLFIPLQLAAVLPGLLLPLQESDCGPLARAATSQQSLPGKRDL